MARRGENIYHRKDGRWEARIPNGVTENGRRKYRSIYGKSYSEVKEKAREQGQQIIQESTKEKSITIEKAMEIWMRDKQPEWKVSTYSCYRQIAQKQIFPQLGQIPIAQMDNHILNDFIAQKRRGKNKLSDSYIRDMTRMLVQCLHYLQNSYGYKIPCRLSALKPRYKVKKQLPDVATLEKLMDYLLTNVKEGDGTCLGILLSCYTGLRIGELCALRWQDFDLETGILHVNRNIQRMTVYEDGKAISKVVFGTPKSINSLRDIPIPPTMLELLKAQSGLAEEYLIRGRNAPYAEPRTLQYRFRNILEQCGIPYFNFHMLRHLFATRCVSLGFDTNSVSELLGHSNIQTTLELYVHSSDERKRELMSKFHLA